MAKTVKRTGPKPKTAAKTKTKKTPKSKPKPKPKPKTKSKTKTTAQPKTKPKPKAKPAAKPGAAQTPDAPATKKKHSRWYLWLLLLAAIGIGFWYFASRTPSGNNAGGGAGTIGDGSVAVGSTGTGAPTNTSFMRNLGVTVGAILFFIGLGYVVWLRAQKKEEKKENNNEGQLTEQLTEQPTGQRRASSRVEPFIRADSKKSQFANASAPARTIVQQLEEDAAKAEEKATAEVVRLLPYEDEVVEWGEHGLQKAKMGTQPVVQAGRRRWKGLKLPKRPKMPKFGRGLKTVKE